MRLVPPDEHVAPLGQSWALPSAGGYEHTLLELTANTGDLSSASVSVLGDTYRGSDVPLQLAPIAGAHLAFRVSRAVFASQIARPGVLQVGEIQVYRDDVLIDTAPPISGVLREAVEIAAPRKWPLLPPGSGP